MQISITVLLSIAAASVANGLVIPKVESRQQQAAELDVSKRNARSKIVKAESSGIPDKYIVVLKEDADLQATTKAVKEAHSEFASDRISASSTDSKFGIDFDFNIKNSFKGFTAEIGSAYLNELAENENVLRIEQDAIVHADEITTQNPAPWGLARMSLRKSFISGFTQGPYLYDSEGGAGVTAYVLDSGIYTDHQSFEGRASFGPTFIEDAEDHVGHGTHCAGTIGSRDYGVAKKANLVAVKVLDKNGYGLWSNIIKGINYVAQEHKNNAGKPGYKGTTANMSLGGSKSESMNDAVNAAVAAGVHVVVSAGNNFGNACEASPASAEGSITVGATDNKDTKAKFSNSGTCVDIFAPGVNIVSTWIGAPSATNTISGTSMAAPHVTGLLTYFLSLVPAANSGFSATLITPESMKKALINYGTHGVLSDIGAGSPNVIIFNGAGADLSNLWAMF